MYETCVTRNNPFTQSFRVAYRRMPNHLLMLSLVLFLASDLHAQVATVKAKGKVLGTVEVIENNVADLTTVTVFIVPQEQRLVVTDVLIASPNGTETDSQRIFRSGVAATSFITVTKNSSFGHSFATGIEFLAGDTVQVRNGDSDGPTHWFLTGYLTKQ